MSDADAAARLREAIVLALIELERDARPRRPSDPNPGGAARARALLEAALDEDGDDGLESAKIIARQYRELHPDRLGDLVEEADRPGMTLEQRDAADEVYRGD